MVVSVVRTWEPDPPQGCKALEWLLLVSEEIETQEQAFEQVDWYRMRWIVEDYHQCLKTGCQIEARQLQTYEGLRALLGFLAPLAVRLLQLRSLARLDPDGIAKEVLPRELVCHCPGGRILRTQGRRRAWLENALERVAAYPDPPGRGPPRFSTLTLIERCG